MLFSKCEPKTITLETHSFPKEQGFIRKPIFSQSGMVREWVEHSLSKAKLEHHMDQWPLHVRLCANPKPSPDNFQQLQYAMQKKEEWLWCYHTIAISVTWWYHKLNLIFTMTVRTAHHLQLRYWPFKATPFLCTDKRAFCKCLASVVEELISTVSKSMGAPAYLSR